MGLLTRLKSLFSEGASRPVFGQGEQGTWFELGKWADGFQQNLTVDDRTAKLIPAAYASVMVTGRAVSQCTPKHFKLNTETGELEQQRNSNAAKVLRAPNGYETWPQFILNAVAQMQFDGEAFALVQRNENNQIESLHRQEPKTVSPYVAPGTTEIFYSIGSSDMFQNTNKIRALVPQRDVLHLRAYCPRNPLIGESPIKAAAMAAGINVALSGSQVAFFNQMSRPSGVISTDQILSREQLSVLRQAWEDQSKGINQGKIPILAGGMKFNAMGISSQDAQLIEAQRMSIEEIARVFGVPLPVIGDLTNSTLTNVEQMVSMWLSISLGAMLESLEQSFSRLFGFDANNKIEFDARALLRTDFAGRIDGLTKGIQGGLYTPNEARNRENLAPVENGDVPYLQQQMIPLGYEPPPPPPPPDPPALPDTEEITRAFEKALN